jgi:uncharacterized protein (TIGR02270 family)
MPTLARPAILTVVQQHLEESACLRSTREALVHAPHVRLHQLRRLDDRIAAHLDGLAVAGEAGASLCEAALESPGVGEVFTATVRAIDSRSAAWLARLLALAQAEPAAEKGLLSAFGWVSAASLRGITKELLASSDPFHRRVGVVACGMHQVDAGPALDAAVSDADPGLRRSAIRVAGELGRVDLLSACLHLASDALAKGADAGGPSGHDALRSALLLGDREVALGGLRELAISGVRRLEATRLLLMAAGPNEARTNLKGLADRPADMRLLIAGIGAAGDVHYVPWLIQQMSNLKLARLAGESFSTITGADLALLDLDLKPPEGPDAGPNDDPADNDVAMEEDDSLPWPDPAKVASWWQANSTSFRPGVRFFMGAPPGLEHCHEVVKSGFQRQRAAAALHLRLMQPGKPLFNTSAPAWRQQRLLLGPASVRTGGRATA